MRGTLQQVATNPSVRYDASGAGGILNIIFKKEQRDGLNGQATALVGTADKYSGAFSLNYRKGELNLFGSYDFRRDHRRINGKPRPNHYGGGRQPDAAPGPPREGPANFARRPPGR